MVIVALAFVTAYKLKFAFLRDLHALQITVSLICSFEPLLLAYTIDVPGLPFLLSHSPQQSLTYTNRKVLARCRAKRSPVLCRYEMRPRYLSIWSLLQACRKLQRERG